MSWASRRRSVYALGVILFFVIIVGGPLAYLYFRIPPTCTDGIMNQGETAIDKGGPCPLVDESRLTSAAVLWARSFRVRDGVYNSVAYIQNPNSGAGIQSVQYRFRLYDEKNILVTERTGTTFIMPSSVTPVFVGNITTGNRVVAHTSFEFTSTPVWEKLDNVASHIAITNTMLSDTNTVPRITATAENSSVVDIRNVTFVAIVLDPAGNAFAASQTAVDVLPAGGSEEIVFTWPDRFSVTVGRMLVLPLVQPETPRAYR